MSDVPMPVDLSEEAVAEWAFLAAMGPESSETWADTDNMTKQDVYRLARAVIAFIEADRTKHRALVREKVREAITATRVQERRNDFTDDDEIVARVMGDHPSNASGGHDEGRPARGEAPRG